MRRLAHVLVAATSMLAALTLSTTASAAPVSAAPNGTDGADTAYVEHEMYAVSLSTFGDHAKRRVGADGSEGDAWFDWSTDLCSAPLVGNTGRSFNFTEPCRRHDFGYRNTKLLDRRYGGNHWNEASRKRIDQKFLSDMLDHCRSRRLIDRPTCTAWAYTFYGAVRVAGGL